MLALLHLVVGSSVVKKPKVTRRIPQLLLVVQEKESPFFEAFETDSSKRNQMDRQYMKSMQTKMQEWYARTKLSALCFAFCATSLSSRNGS
ncbi:uncharacterized protein [Pocillopora verrucosa]|uniref:uncharacterized protein n=1 Tax=Pocillopora verrucosa TaxID=203993 RepID=UPI0033404D50